MNKTVLRFENWLAENEQPEETTDQIEGGLADSKTVEDVAAKHGVTVEEISAELEKGIKVESEHTDDPAIAKEIAMDHLMEAPDYYEKLATIENHVAKPAVCDMFEPVAEIINPSEFSKPLVDYLNILKTAVELDTNKIGK